MTLGEIATNINSIEVGSGSSSGNGGSNTCHGTLVCDAPVSGGLFLRYVSSEQQPATTTFVMMDEVDISVMCNSFILAVGSSYQYDGGIELYERIGSGESIYTLYFVTGDFTLTAAL
jgi:hypothetical protein